ncbi:MAG: TIM barrel protein [Rhodothermales bacterium]
MDRRHFVKSGLAAGTAALGAPAFNRLKDPSPAAFKLHYAPHFGMFKHHAGEDFVDQVKFMADMGFTAMEDNGMKGRSVADQERIAAEMGRRGMKMGVFVAHSISWNEPSLTSGKADLREAFLADIRGCIDVAKRVNATWMTVVPGYVDLRLNHDYQTANVVESLKRACDILEPHGLVIVLEALNFRDHPGQFLQRTPQSYEICKAVGSPSCKILDDLYHMQIQEGNLIPNIDLAWDEIGYFQIGDNPGRDEPTTGEINYKNVFKHIHAKGWTGILGMEHGLSGEGKEGEAALIRAYQEVDGF